MKIIGHATVLTLGREHKVIHDGAVAYDEKKIHAVGTTEQLRERFPKAKVKSASGRVVLPGFVNTHMHLYSTFARGIALKDAPPKNFVEILERLWWRLDKGLRSEDLHLSAIIPMLDAVRNGVTTMIDHHASPHALAGSLDIIRDAFRKAGIRGGLCYEISDRDGASRRDAGFEENANFIRGNKLDSQHDIAAMIGLHASFTLEDQTLARAAELMKGLKCGIHIHCAEAKADLEDARKRGYRSVVDRLHKFGLTGPESIFAHCVHCDTHDIQTLALTQTKVVHNPRSNMNNAVGCAAVEEMMRERVHLSLGTDGFSASPLADMAVANILHKHQAGDPRKIYGEIWKMFAVNGPALASAMFKQPLGILEEGAGSGIVIRDYYPPTPISEDNTLGHLLFGLTSARVHTTICQGKPVYEDGNYTFLSEGEEKEICEKSSELAKALWERF